MTKIAVNLPVNNSVLQNQGNVLNHSHIAPQSSKISLDEYFRREKRKNNGLIEKFYNKIKNLTGLGVGSKKVEKVVADAKTGKASPKEVLDITHKYHTSQENSAQLFGDAASVTAGGITYFVLRRKIKMLNSAAVLNKNITKLTEKIGIPNKLSETFINLGKSNKKLMGLVLGTSALIAGSTKFWLLKFNRAGSKEFIVDENLYGKKKTRNSYQKYLAKQEKKKLKKERIKTNFKNFASGMINGLMFPAFALGGIIGAPLYLVGNSLNRYFVANKTDKKKSFGGYIDNLKTDGVIIGAATAAAAVPLVKKGNFIKVFDENLKKATDKLEKATLKTPDYAGKSSYENLQDILFSNKTIDDVIYDSKISIEDKIKKLTDENIFAVKFKQISNDRTELTKALRENCPPSRTLDEAKQYITNALGSGYEIKKLLGVGTVAETYLAKSPDGKEVCIKIIKNGIDENKILKDKEKFINMVKNSKDYTEDEKDFLLKNIEDLASGISKEIDLKNELEAANKLVPYTKIANVVKPIEVKNGVYVMEKAHGISLESLVELNSAKLYKEALQENKKSHVFLKPASNSKLGQLLIGKKTKEEQIKAINQYIKRIEARTPEFGDISLSKKDIDNLINEYMKVLTEQFVKVEKNGKAIHADIHPGNIFIDINALKKKNKNKIFTLIDTGNVVEQNLEQSLRAVNLTSYTKRANVKDLTDYLLEGAKLPQGMTKEEATKKISEELKKSFFDTETKLNTVTNDSILTLGSNIMRKYNIIPGDTQMNLNKAKQSASNSLNHLLESLLRIRLKDVDGVMSGMSSLSKITADITLAKRKFNAMIAKQEKDNLKILPLQEKIKQKNNPNNLPKNSEDYLIYKLKQLILDV